MCKNIYYIVYIFALCTKRRRNIDEEQRCDICGCGDCRGFCNFCMGAPSMSVKADTPLNGWYEENGAKYWYERSGVRQGTEGRGKGNL